MSSNVHPVAQAQVVTVTALVPGFASPPPYPPIPPSTSPAYTGELREPPQLSANLNPDEARRELAAIVAKYGFVSAAIVAAQYHNARNSGGAKPYTEWELIMRDLRAAKNLGAKYSAYHQGAPNALALRLLAPRAGQSYPFDSEKTWGRNKRGKLVFGQKCGCPGCEYRDRDRKRHSDEVHVRDPAFALCCPYQGCCIVYLGGSARFSQMEHHCEEHEKQNKGEKKGRRGNMPLSTFCRP